MHPYYNRDQQGKLWLLVICAPAQGKTSFAICMASDFLLIKACQIYETVIPMDVYQL